MAYPVAPHRQVSFLSTGQVSNGSLEHMHFLVVKRTAQKLLSGFLPGEVNQKKDKGVGDSTSELRSSWLTITGACRESGE